MGEKFKMILIKLNNGGKKMILIKLNNGGKKMIKEIKVDGVTYVPKSEIKSTAFNLAKPKGNMSYVLVRTYSAGVFVGYLKSSKGQEAELINARRLWYWDGAASLSQLAMEGVSKPENCKFPCEVSEVKLLNVIEIIQVSDKAKKSISEVDIWQK